MFELLTGQPKLTTEDFADLFKQYSAQLFRIAFSYVRDEDTAYDLVQVAFEKAMKNADSFRGSASARSWLTSILVNTVKNYLRDNKKFVDDSSLEYIQEPAPTMGRPPADPHTSIADAEDMGILADAYNLLSARQREVVRLRVETGMSFKEVSSALDITANDARVTYHQAVKKLKRAVQEKLLEPAVPDTGTQKGG